MLEEKILREYRRIAMVGASANPERDSYQVASYLMEHGYNVIPVNPNAPEILGKTTYPDLSSIPEQVEVVNIFRRPEEVKPIVDEAIKIGAKVVWLQEGIVNPDAEKVAQAAGLDMVMNTCMRKTHQRLTS